MSDEMLPAADGVVMHDPRLNDPEERLVHRSHLPPSELADVVVVLNAMRRWGEAESRLSQASQRYMRLGETDMRALRLLIAARNQSIPITPGMIASHLAISTAATTKLLGYMRLGETDMRALRLLIAARNQSIPITPGMIASHLAISTAATTKLLDRLERGGHVRRGPHPTDRRSLTVEVTDETRSAARESVGRSHARRFDVIAALSTAERAVVAAFFDAMSATVPEGDDEPEPYRPAGADPTTL